MPHVRVGTSGWAYDHWRGLFYPQEVAKSRWFEYYASQFDTVELNNTFYATPSETAVRRWHDTTGPEFLFAIKGSRYISHTRRLEQVKESLQRQDAALAPLGKKQGPILWQLPPRGELDLPALRRFVQLRPKRQRWCFEFRHASFFCEGVYELLREHDCALVWADTPRYPLATEVTGSFLYARLHGHEEFYVSRYTDDQLKWWRDELTEASDGRRDIFAYFDNDAEAHAPADALRLRELLA